MKSLGRMCIYPKDISRITGKSHRYSSKLLQKIRAEFQKEEHQLITVEEFCRYTGLKNEQVESYIK